MKNARLGDYLLWQGRPAKVVAESSGYQVVIELFENCKCPHCHGDLGKEQLQMIVASPLFQQGAERMPSIIDDPTLTVT